MTKERSRRLRDILASKSIRSFGANASWLMAERVFVLAVTLGTSVWMARYLGSEAFGILNYAIAFVSLFSFLPYLGLDTIITRRLVEDPDARPKLLGTTLTLRLGAAVLAAAAVIVIAAVKAGDPTTRLMLAIIAIGIVLDPFDTVDNWFQARLESRYAVLARSLSVGVGGLVRVILILAHAPLVAFAVAVLVQQLVKAAAMMIIYSRRHGDIRHWSVDWGAARKLLSLSWPLALSAAGSQLYFKIDQVMIGEMVNASEVGVYAVAARMSEVWYFIPTALGTSLLPMMVQSRSRGEEAYHARLQSMYDAMLWGGVAVAIAVTVVAYPVIDLLYGSEYRPAAAILQMHIWACPSFFMSTVLARWLIIEELMIFALTRHFLGALANVGLNLILIPAYGGMGAAIATLLSYTAANYFACFTDRRTWHTGVLMTRAFIAPYRLIKMLI
jgi:O-antigen/teichoic acid export membrane protein